MALDSSSKPTILVVDDTADIRELITSVLQDIYTVRPATDGRSALKRALERPTPDLVLLDVEIPGATGYDVCRALKITAATAEIPVIFLTAKDDPADVVRGFQVGAADFIIKPLNAEVLRARVRNHLELSYRRREQESLVRERTVELETARVQLVRRLARTMEYHESTAVGNRVVRLGHYARLIAQAAGAKPALSDLIMKAAPLHDIGKLGVPAQVLHKSSGLTAPEWEQMKKHAEIGAEIIGVHDDPLLALAHTLALTHHERWDGNGYPKGLKGEEIPWPGRIMALVDTFEALTVTRFHQEPLPIDGAATLIVRASGTQFDPKIIDAFKQVLPEMRAIRDTYADQLGDLVDLDFASATAPPKRAAATTEASKNDHGSMVKLQKATAEEERALTLVRQRNQAELDAVRSASEKQLAEDAFKRTAEARAAAEQETTQLVQKRVLAEQAALEHTQARASAEASARKAAEERAAAEVAAARLSAERITTEASVQNDIDARQKAESVITHAVAQIERASSRKQTILTAIVATTEDTQKEAEAQNLAQQQAQLEAEILHATQQRSDADLALTRAAEQRKQAEEARRDAALKRADAETEASKAAEARARMESDALHVAREREAREHEATRAAEERATAEHAAAAQAAARAEADATASAAAEARLAAEQKAAAQSAVLMEAETQATQAAQARQVADNALATAAIDNKNTAAALQVQATARAEAEAAAIDAAKQKQAAEDAAKEAAEQRFQAESSAAQLAAEHEAAALQARLAAEERGKEEAAAAEAAHQAKDAKDRAYTEEQARLRAEAALAQATADRQSAEIALQGEPRDLALALRPSRLSRTRRALATAVLIAAVGGAAFHAASNAPAPSASAPSLNLGASPPVALKYDGNWQSVTPKSQLP